MRPPSVLRVCWTGCELKVFSPPRIDPSGEDEKCPVQKECPKGGLALTISTSADALWRFFLLPNQESGGRGVLYSVNEAHMQPDGDSIAVK